MNFRFCIVSWWTKVLKCHTLQGKFKARNSEASVHSQLCGVILQQRKTGKRQLERQNGRHSEEKKVSGREWQPAMSRMSRQLRAHQGCCMMGDCLMCFPRVHRRGHGALSSVPGPNLRHCLSGWHLKCCFLTTYANCCNFPDEAASWYLDAAKIVLHFLCEHRSAIWSM